MIYLRGVSHKDLELILTFVYTGQVTFEQERLSKFLKAAKDLKIYGIDQKTDNIHSCPEAKTQFFNCSTTLSTYSQCFWPLLWILEEFEILSNWKLKILDFKVD